VEQGKIRHFSHCFTAYQQEYYRDHNILPVTAVTAIALSQPQVQRLKEKLSTITGKDILLSNQVEPALLGGMRLDYDGKQLEDSIAQRMHNIRQLLKNTVL
jgi:F-type H+-transporting ATPase subunit delta